MDEFQLKKLKKKDQQMWLEVYDKYNYQVISFIYNKVKHKEISEDIFSKTWLQAVKNIQKLSYRNENSFIAWIIKIASNELKQHYRKVGNSIVAQQKLETESSTSFNFLDNELIDLDFFSLDLSSLNIKDKQKRVIEMVFFEGHNHKYVAKEFKCTEQAARAFLYRTIKEIRQNF